MPMAKFDGRQCLAYGRRVVRLTYAGVRSKHTSQLAAGLSYYFILSLFPLLIAFAAGLALVPLPHLFDQILMLMGRFIPADSMGLVRGVLRDVISPHGGSILSVGIVLTIWAASGGVAALVEAVNVAYNLDDRRSFVRKRLLAIGLMFAVGTLAILALALMVVGPGFGRWLAGKAGLGGVFVALWPYLRWALSIACAVLSIELIYMWAPSVRRRFRSTLPGAVIALVTWLVLSSGLGLYLRNFGKLNKTYGTLAAAVALLLWLYWTAFSILIGAQFNAETMRKEEAAAPAQEETSTAAQERPATHPATAA
ncbi:MAG TPA: YihY/virulence factor BrkB family protein [Terriglobales bacterium]|nr:YihY/virulence factor BrkB family protein [Terriglobales bacterium]